MATSLPVPIEFRLPAGWEAADPDQAGAPGAAFVAVYPSSGVPGFTTNITIDGEHRQDTATLTEIADESVERIRQAAQAVLVQQRSEFGSTEVPGMTQVLHVRVATADATRELVQCQVSLLMPDTHDPSMRALIRLVLTAPEEQFAEVVGEFRDFVATVRPDVSHTDQ